MLYPPSPMEKSYIIVVVQWIFKVKRLLTGLCLLRQDSYKDIKSSPTACLKESETKCRDSLGNPRILATMLCIPIWFT